MRVFLPSTLPALAEALRAGQVGANPDSSPAADPGPLSGYAVTPALRESYASGDEEELEYAALTAAARASLRMLADDPAAPPRRVVLAAEIPALAEALRAGQVGANPDSSPAADPGPLAGYAVTPALRESYASGDEEELEYAALTAAARASLRLLADDPAAPPRRVVLAAEIPAEQTKLDPRDHEPGRVLITAAVPVKLLVSAHADDTDAGADVRAAADALPAADAGDEDAQFAVDGAEGHELGWYATQELSYLAE